MALSAQDCKNLNPMKRILIILAVALASLTARAQANIPTFEVLAMGMAFGENLDTQSDLIVCQKKTHYVRLYNGILETPLYKFKLTSDIQEEDGGYEAQAMWNGMSVFMRLDATDTPGDFVLLIAIDDKAGVAMVVRDASGEKAGNGK